VLRGGEKAGEERQRASKATAVERMGFVPDAWQERVLKSRARQGILNCSRQCGKSTVTAVMAVERAHTEAESLTLVVSGGDRPVCPQGTPVPSPAKRGVSEEGRAVRQETGSEPEG